MWWLIHLWLQCVTFGSFTTSSSEMAYGLMTLMLTYGLPLLTILICYLGIWFRIFQTSFEHFQGTFSAIHLVLSSTSFIDSVVKVKVIGLGFTTTWWELIDWLIYAIAHKIRKSLENGKMRNQSILWVEKKIDTGHSWFLYTFRVFSKSSNVLFAHN